MRHTSQIKQNNPAFHASPSHADEEHKTKRQKTSASTDAATDPMPIDTAVPPTGDEAALDTTRPQIPITNAGLLALTLPAASGPASRPTWPDAASLTNLKTLLLYSTKISEGCEHVYMSTQAGHPADHREFDRNNLPCHALLASQLSPHYFRNNNHSKLCKSVIRSLAVHASSPEVQAQTLCDAMALNRDDEKRVARYGAQLSALTDQHPPHTPHAARIQRYLEAEHLLQTDDAPLPANLVDALLDILPGEGQAWTATSVCVLMLLSHAGSRISEDQSARTCTFLTRFLAFVSLLPAMGEINPRSFWLDLMSGELLLPAWEPLTAQQKRSLLDDLPDTQIAPIIAPLLEAYAADRTIPFPDRLGFLQRLALCGHGVDGAAKALTAAFGELTGNEQREILARTAYVDRLTLPLITAFAHNAGVPPEDRIDVLRLFARQPVPDDTRALLVGLLQDLQKALQESL